MSNVVIVGASRGIGLGFAEQYLAAGHSVVATHRTEVVPDALQALQSKYPNTLSVYSLEVTDEEAITRFAKTVQKVHILILNAGIKGYPIPYTRPTGNTKDELTAALAVNTVAPDAIIRAFYPILQNQEDACVVYMGSKVGQTADNESGGSHPYRISKAAAHAMVWNWSIELMQNWGKAHGTNLTHSPLAVAICPGWVRTDMGGPNARLSVEESVSKMRQVIADVGETKESNGLYMYDGTKAETYPIPSVLKEIFDAKKRPDH